MGIFQYLSQIEQFFWSYIGFALICISGAYLTVYSKGFQFKTLFHIKQILKALIHENKYDHNRGINPLKLYFASVGGMIGVGNIVGVGVAVSLGGPGSIFWIWVASFCGMLIKYCEIYLGVKYRVVNSQGSYDGGPMFYLTQAFSGITGKVLAYLSAILLCIYSTEIFQFTVIVNNFHGLFAVDKNYIIAGLLLIVLYVGVGGINRLANICSILMPIFITSYVSICLFIILLNITVLPEALFQIVRSAFLGQAAIGGFLGSTMIFCGYQGISAAVYSGDIGIGYDSVIQSETRVVNPKRQAQLSIYALLSDTFICSMTTLVIAVTKSWHQIPAIEQTKLMTGVLKKYIPYSDIFMTLVLFFAGYTTITAFLAAGQKGAKFISPKYGARAFIAIASLAFVFFAHSPPAKAKTVMQIAGGMLILINTIAIIKLRKQIDFT
jgi:AGCS family alanine or glycine:cation symporter